MHGTHQIRYRSADGLDFEIECQRREQASYLWRKLTESRAVADKVTVAEWRQRTPNHHGGPTIEGLYGRADSVVWNFQPAVRTVAMHRKPLDSDPARVSVWDVDRWHSPVILHIPNAFQGKYARYSVLYIGPQGITRREHGGPLEPGPYAALIPQCSVIDNAGGSASEAARNRAALREWTAAAGDLLLLNKSLYRINDGGPHRDPGLTHLVDPLDYGRGL